MRWLGPAICWLVAAWTFGTLHGGSGPAWVLVGMDRLVGPDPGAQAALTWKLFAGVGSVWGLWALAAKPQVDAPLDE